MLIVNYPELQTKNYFQSTKKCSVWPWRVSTTGIVKNDLNWTDWWSNWPIASKSEEKTEKTEQRLRRATMVAHFVSPLIATSFAVVYWVVGMYNVMHPGTTTQWMEIGYVRKWSRLSIFHISIFRLFHASLFICLLRRCAADLYL